MPDRRDLACLDERLAGPRRSDLMIAAALDGVGLAYSTEPHIGEHLASPRLVRVLEDWCPPYPDFFLYYPSRRNGPSALRALVEMLLESSD